MHKSTKTTGMNKPFLTKSESLDAIIEALQYAKCLNATSAQSRAKITLLNLDPAAVQIASHTFKTRLYGANANKKFVHCSVEPYEESNIEIIVSSRPLDNLTIRAIEYTATHS